jgi:hypothetical protein
MRSLRGAALLLCLFSSPVAANDMRGTLQTFGFFGRWAPHCDQPASLTNSVRNAKVTEDGRIEFTESLGEQYQPNRYVVLDARKRGADAVILRIELNNAVKQDLTMVKRGGLLRTMTNRQLSDDKLIVKGGIVTATKQKTPWLTRCGDDQAPSQ